MGAPDPMIGKIEPVAAETARRAGRVVVELAPGYLEGQPDRAAIATVLEALGLKWYLNVDAEEKRRRAREKERMRGRRRKAQTTRGEDVVMDHRSSAPERPETA